MSAKGYSADNDQLEQSVEMIGRILNALAIKGLRVQDLDFETLAHGREETADQVWEAHELFTDVMVWLSKENVITYSEAVDFGDGDVFHGAQLTSKGLYLLNRRIGESADTFGTEISKVAQGPITSEAANRWGDFLGGVLGGITKSISGG